MNYLVAAFVVLITHCHYAFAQTSDSFLNCQDDKARAEARSKELAELERADQSDRQNFQTFSAQDLIEMQKRYTERRKRVGEIFGEGCFATAADYANAALIFQHGNTPDHFFQTYLWAKRAVELGDASQKRLMALGIDRYLINLGRKQLFGSQANKPDTKAGTCWCREQVEKSFPDRKRREIAGKTLRESSDWLKDLNKGNRCSNGECAAKLKPSPRGTIPGFW